MRRIAIQVFLVIVLVASIQAQSDAVQKTQKIINEVVEKSFPELKTKKIEVKNFQSESDYFQSRFSFGKMLTFQKMRYIIFVNPKVFEKNAPESGIRSIIAHEIAHVLYYSKRNRMELLGLIKLSSKDFTQKFERGADLEAIARGYGNGIKDYRQWLYLNIPQKNLEEKKRNYFSPEEIDLMLEILRQKPEMMEKWRKNIPRNRTELMQ
ncbi:MAG TPA: hypothetical protein PKY82_28165 [Pyrinomonadaceae bacterium]|nr:hypothetical protein [Pyrinomonadaceae bacterium]